MSETNEGIHGGMEEFGRQVMGSGAGTQFPHVKAADADLADKHGRGGIWFMPANPEMGIQKDSINYPILARVLIEKHGLRKSTAGTMDGNGKRLTTSDIYKIIRDEISIGFPEAPEKAKAAYPVLMDAIPQAAVEPGADGMQTYLENSMPQEVADFKAGANIKTGFSRLDAATGGIYPGLYAVGAISSLGKTTLMHQMADQMAAAGAHVLFFSLEMSRLELASKSLARITAKRDINTAVSSLAIRKGKGGEAVKAAILEYASSVENRMNVIEGNFLCNPSYIGEYTRSYMERTGAKPVLFIDYLQVLQPDPDHQRAQLREAIDSNVTELKRLSRALNIPIFVISSVNRANYLAPVDFESFKESGGIEFTADCVWGLQLSCMNEDLFAKEKDIVKKRNRVREAKAEMPRKVDLVYLKTRYSNPDIVTHFSYYPRFDLFEETGIEGTDAESGMTIV